MATEAKRIQEDHEARVHAAMETVGDIIKYDFLPKITKNGKVYLNDLLSYGIPTVATGSGALVDALFGKGVLAPQLAELTAGGAVAVAFTRWINEQPHVKKSIVNKFFTNLEAQAALGVAVSGIVESIQTKTLKPELIVVTGMLLDEVIAEQIHKQKGFFARIPIDRKHIGRIMIATAFSSMGLWQAIQMGAEGRTAVAWALGLASSLNLAEAFITSADQDELMVRALLNQSKKMMTSCVGDIQRLDTESSRRILERNFAQYGIQRKRDLQYRRLAFWHNLTIELSRQLQDNTTLNSQQALAFMEDYIQNSFAPIPLEPGPLRKTKFKTSLPNLQENAIHFPDAKLRILILRDFNETVMKHAQQEVAVWTFPRTAFEKVHDLLNSILPTQNDTQEPTEDAQPEAPVSFSDLQAPEWIKSKAINEPVTHEDTQFAVPAPLLDQQDPMVIIPETDESTPDALTLNEQENIQFWGYKITRGKIDDNEDITGYTDALASGNTNFIRQWLQYFQDKYSDLIPAA